MPERLVWREPVPADARALGLMHHRSWVDTYASLLPRGWFDEHGPEEWVERWHRQLEEPRDQDVRRLAVFVPDGSVAGLVVTGPGLVNRNVPPVRDLALRALYVVSSRLGSGLGQQLLDRSLGDRPAELWTARGNERALAFYRRNGFAEDGTVVEDARVPLVETRMVR